MRKECIISNRFESPPKKKKQDSSASRAAAPFRDVSERRGPGLSWARWLVITCEPPEVHLHMVHIPAMAGKVFLDEWCSGI